MLQELLEKIKDKKYYLIITVIFFIFLIFMNHPFDKSYYTYTSQNAENLVGQTDFLVAKNKVSQNFVAQRDDLVKIGIKTVTQDREINSKANIEIKEAQTKKTIYNKDISLLGAKNDSYFEIEIDRQKNSKNKEYEIIITSLDAEKSNATMFALADNVEGTGEIYKYNDVEVKENKLMLSTEYYSFPSAVCHIVIWVIIFIVSIIFILFGLDGADEKTFLKLVLIVTVLYIFITPFPHYYDEWSHFFRAMLISQGDFYDDINEVGEIGGYVVPNLKAFLFKKTTLEHFSSNMLPEIDLFAENKVFDTLIYFSSTIPIGHTIPAIALVVGKILHLGTYPSIFLARLLPYIFYVACSYFAIKNLKYYKSILFIIATMPIALYLGASVSLDPIINGSAFLFISICLKYYFATDEDTYITKNDIALLIITAILIITNKYLTYTPLVLLFFLIPKKKFKATKAYITMIIVSIIIGVLCVLWQFYMIKAFPYEEDRNGNVNQEEQIQFTLEHPVLVTRTIITQSMAHLKVHTQGYTQVPLGSLPQLTGVILVIGAVLEKGKFNKGKHNRIFNISLLVIFIIVLLLGTFALYLSFTPVGANNVQGYQARYNIPILMLILIPIANLCIVENKTKNYERRVAFLMFLLNIDAMLAVLIEVFTKL